MFQCYSLNSSHPLLTLLCACLFSMSVSLSCPANRLISTIFRFHKYVLIYICSPLYDLLHSVKYTLGSSTSLELTQVCSFLWVSNIPMCVYHIFFIHLSVDGRVDCFHILAIVNYDALTIGVYVSFQISVFIFFSYIASSELAGYMIALFLMFWGIILFSTVVAPMCMKVPFLHILSKAW